MEKFASLQANQGVNPLPYNPCKLLGFELVVLTDGQTVKGSTANREVLAVLLGGKATFEVAGKTFEKVGGRANVFGGKPYSVYMPAGADYTITGVGNVQIALTSAPSDLEAEPYVIAPSQVANGIWGAANFKRYYHEILTGTSQPDLPARRLIVGETFTPSGNWSTYPAHKHEVDNLPAEAYMEEMYYFRVNPANGIGICRWFNDAGEEHNFTVRDNTILMAPDGYHTVVSTPGYMTYYLWFLAGTQRVQATVADPVAGWVNNTIPMLKELGF